MYSVVMVVAMTGAPEVPQCDFFSCKPKVCCTTTTVVSHTPQPVNCCPQASCAPKKCCLLKCFSFCGHGHNTMAAPGCGTVVIPPTTGTVTPDVKKDMPKGDPKPADPKKLGPAPTKVG